MHTGPTLEVNLEAIARNYALLKGRLAGGECTAVVKADAYGLGAEAIAPALHRAGCRTFFVATLDEGIALRHIIAEHEYALPDDETGTAIFVFHGCRSGEAKDFTEYALTPVLNSPEQVTAWNNAGPAAAHIDTGMNRLGFTLKEVQELSGNNWWRLVMSHLACAGEPEHRMNARQLADFRTALEAFPGPRPKASLANSSGIFLGHDYHFDLARPGCSLYGISPNTALPNPMENVVTLSAPVLQYRTLEKLESVGYGASATAEAGTVLATVEMGYADGFLRSLSNKALGFAAGVRAPLLGRVSMDMVSVDVSAVPEHLRTADLRVNFIGKEQPVDMVAKEAGTIGYEIFTRLGSRVKRVYA